MFSDRNNFPLYVDVAISLQRVHNHMQYLSARRMVQKQPTKLINYAKLCSKNTAVAFKREWFMQLHTPEIRRQWHFRGEK